LDTANYSTGRKVVNEFAISLRAATPRRPTNREVKPVGDDFCPGPGLAGEYLLMDDSILSIGHRPYKGA